MMNCITSNFGCKLFWCDKYQICQIFKGTNVSKTATTFKKFLEQVAPVEGSSNFAQLIATLFAVRNKVHELHLSTESFAEHSALKELYELLIDYADELAEMYQGRFGKISLPAPSVIVQSCPQAFIASFVEWLEMSKTIFVGDNSAILNKYEELLGEVYKIKYKLENLS